MNKNELIKKVAADTGKTQSEVKEIVDSAFAVISAKLGNGEKVSISDFGTFSVVEKAARNFHNPNSGKVEISEAHNVIKFQPAALLKNAVN